MIISASYKTDIPAFYGKWFINRLRAGYCSYLNPYNKQPIKISLRRESIYGFVFWTKNILPFKKHLAEIHENGFPFFIQHTITGYPKQIEPSVIAADKCIDAIIEISTKYGKKSVVWRYDTILITDITSINFHIQNFKNIAEKLKGIVDEVIVSFVHEYRKTRNNIIICAKNNGFSWTQPTLEQKHDLLKSLALIAIDNNMTISSCAQRELLIENVHDAKCIDAERLSSISGIPIPAQIKGNRPECGCYQARDIGEYDTCPHGCIYCYAVQNPKIAMNRFRQHDPNSEFLFNPEPITEKPSASASGTHPQLFDDLDI